MRSCFPLSLTSVCVAGLTQTQFCVLILILFTLFLATFVIIGCHRASCTALPTTPSWVYVRNNFIFLNIYNPQGCLSSFRGKGDYRGNINTKHILRHIYFIWSFCFLPQPSSQLGMTLPVHPTLQVVLQSHLWPQSHGLVSIYSWAPEAQFFNHMHTLVDRFRD